MTGARKLRQSGAQGEVLGQGLGQERQLVQVNVSAVSVWFWAFTGGQSCISQVWGPVPHQVLTHLDLVGHQPYRDPIIPALKISGIMTNAATQALPDHLTLLQSLHPGNFLEYVCSALVPPDLAQMPFRSLQASLP